MGELVSADEKPWEKKPEQNITTMDFSGTVEMVKANMFFIKKKGISQYALNKIKRLGEFKNPDFYKSQAMRLSIYNKPRIIDTTEETDKFLCIPRGCEESLLALPDNAGAEYIADCTKIMTVNRRFAFTIMQIFLCRCLKECIIKE